MAASSYNFPDGQQGITYDSILFSITVNSSGLNLTGAYIEMDLYDDLQAPCPVAIYSTTGSGINTSGLSIVSPTGQFQFNTQIVYLNAGLYSYNMNFFLNDGSIRQYFTGNWNIVD